MSCTGNKPCKCKTLKCSVCKCATKIEIAPKLKGSGITVRCLKCQVARPDNEQA